MKKKLSLLLSLFLGILYCFYGCQTEKLRFEYEQLTSDFIILINYTLKDIKVKNLERNHRKYEHYLTTMLSSPRIIFISLSIGSFSFTKPEASYFLVSS